MSVIDPNAIFDSLTPPATLEGGRELVFATAALPGWTGYFIGRTCNDEPALLIQTGGSGYPPPPIRLQALAVYHDALCRIATVGQKFEEKKFTVVWNVGSDIGLRRYFLGLVAALIPSLGKAPTTQKVFEAVDALAELFRALGRPSRKSTQGLWAELLVLAQASNTTALAKAWHDTPDDRFDFNAGAQRVEVKSSSVTRRHHFALEQLAMPEGVECVVASLLTTRASGGSSLEHLLNRVLARLESTPDLQTHIYRVVAETLGANLAIGLEEAYDEQLGRESLKFYRAQDIPSVPLPVAAEVSDVRFVADISRVAPLDLESLAARGGLFAAVSA